jgi:prolyl 4-hydroxylase
MSSLGAILRQQSLMLITRAGGTLVHCGLARVAEHRAILERGICPNLRRMRVTVRVSPAGATPDDRHYITIDPLLSPDECREWIDFAEQLGFYDAPINLGRGIEVRRPDIRNNTRTLVDDPDRASALWQRTKPLLPAHVLRDGRVHATGFNERLRFYRDLGVVTPKTGLALCFRHPHPHEGRAVRSGVKYVLRTDIMYGLV